MTAFAPQTKLLCHSGLLDRWDAPPVGIEISPTNACNAKCPWCFYAGTHTRDELETGIVIALLDSLAAMGVKSVTWSGGGEPTMHSEIDELIEYAAGRGLKQGMFTNAYRPIESPGLLDWIRITVTERFTIAKHVAEYAKATDTGVVFNVTRDNAEHLERMLNEAIEDGVKYFQFRPALAATWDQQEEVPYPDWIETYRNQVNIVDTPYKWADYRSPHGYPKCHGHRLVPFVWHNGDVAVCAYHFGEPEFTFGNLKEERFRDIWLGERRRQMVEAGVSVIPTCQHCCKLHEINKPLAVVAGDVERPEHLEFI